MKRMMVISMVLLLGVAALGIAGCGSGNTSQAKTVMQTADAAYATINSELNNLQSSLTSVLGGAISGNFTALTPQVLAQATASVDKVLAKMPAARADYKKITTLTGVPDYVAYAQAMIKAIDANTAAITAGKTMITDITPLVQAGNTAAVQSYFTTNASKINGLQALSTAATNAYNNARSIKTQKNL